MPTKRAAVLAPFSLLVALAALAACAGDDSPLGPDADTVLALCADDAPDQPRPSWWTVDTHCKGAAADYDLLFDDTRVHRIDIAVARADYDATMADLEELFGGSGGGPGGPPGGPGELERDPIWVPVTVDYDGHRWTEVGMRYKGNSSLRLGYQAGFRKLAFRLSFDEYEDAHPELDDQRFHGFEKMTFANGFVDPTLIHDKLAGDILRAAGVPVARSAFARVYVDHGDGPSYFGLYTMIEDPSDELLDSQFADGSGNLYKPEGRGADLQGFDQTAFVKKTNEQAADWSDVQALIAALHGDRADAAAWRAELEAHVDVAGFLRWLALNQAMVNWDTYGWAPHNYYLYADPSAGGRFTWIPWDMNEALMDRGEGGPWVGADSVLLDEIDGDWPLIRYLLDDPVYAAAYRDELAAAAAGAFAFDAVSARAHAYHELIAPFVTGADGERYPYSFVPSAADFDASITGPGGLDEHLAARHAALAAALE